MMLRAGREVVITAEECGEDVDAQSVCVMDALNSCPRTSLTACERNVKKHRGTVPCS